MEVEVRKKLRLGNSETQGDWCSQPGKEVEFKLAEKATVVLGVSLVL
jgi:hypothetical protein